MPKYVHAHSLLSKLLSRVVDELSILPSVLKYPAILTSANCIRPYTVLHVRLDPKTATTIANK